MSLFAVWADSSKMYERLAGPEGILFISLQNPIRIYKLLKLSSLVKFVKPFLPEKAISVNT